MKAVTEHFVLEETKPIHTIRNQRRHRNT